MARRLLSLGLAAALLAGAVACGDDDSDAADDGDTTTTEAADDAAGTEPVVQVTDTPLGTILTDAEGNTVYVFLDDDGATSTCTDACATTWPPVEVGGAPVGEGVDAPLGTTTRDDGSTQLIVAGQPVYTYAGDQGPGDTSGHGVGDVWYVVGADGEPITSAAAAPTTALEGGAGDY